MSWTETYNMLRTITWWAGFGLFALLILVWVGALIIGAIQERRAEKEREAERVKMALRRVQQEEEEQKRFEEELYEAHPEYRPPDRNRWNW